MRHFTKDHNDLRWLFPIWEKSTQEDAENMFEYYEREAEYFFEMAHDGEEVFTKDDLIDAFMKGASEAHKTLIDTMSNLGIIKK